ncbi:4Fe-4S dicluster domain-containing protein [Puteibacter caeruleilacunae]|nr:4Fe-4S dicluster domain-containing protein [Puteibacter caeruleilacunae]
MNKYWRSIEELNDSSKLKQEELTNEIANKKALNDPESIETFASTRRDFLKVFGFSVAGAAVVASCKKPVEKAIPYLVRPEEIIPGQCNYYASSYFEENEYCGVLVKVRDGRPIKIEGNEQSSLTKGGTSARVQASVMSLYDLARYKEPLATGEKITWEKVNNEIPQKLEEIAQADGKIVLLTSTVISPTYRQVITELQERFQGLDWIQYDAVSSSGMLEANDRSFGKAAIPTYHFDKAKVIVSFGADFLGTWISPVEFTKQYSSRRNPDLKEQMSRHYQVESMMTLTGSNADERVVIKSSDEGIVLLNLYNEIAKQLGGTTYAVDQSSTDLSFIVRDLLLSKGESLVVCGSNNPDHQVIVNAINSMLGNYGATIDMISTNRVKQGDDRKMSQFVEDLLNGKVDALLAVDVNPVYNYPQGEAIKDAIEKLKLSVAFAKEKQETAEACKYILPLPHYLESWGDTEPTDGKFSLIQPTIHPLFNSRPVQEVFLAWCGKTGNYRDVIKFYWEANVFPKQTDNTEFTSWWNTVLQRGVFDEISVPEEQPIIDVTSLKATTTRIKSVSKTQGDVEVVVYEMNGKGNGAMANNPWSMEMPDSVSKVSWDNFAAISPRKAIELGVDNEDMVALGDLELPVFIQPGQEENTIAVALGFGRSVSGKVAEGAGFNVYPFINVVEGRRMYQAFSTVKKLNKTYPLAMTQTHHSMEGREIVREAVLEEYSRKANAGNESHERHEKHHVTLYDEPEFPAHQWGLAIDLNKCTGCGNCTIACQAENNVAVIGKEQVRNRRIMHWIRIDRYYSENPENPKTYHQPVMCQHCDNAPCENVCPVSATMHSNEGLNQMVYNRCVGTRYCINNCPYKVRRFNWFKYANNEKFDFNVNNDLGKMVLNPDVTVRSRGVVEKCSLCVQRIQEKKLEAKLENRQLNDGEIQPACMQTCPADAIVFGDLKDPESRISKLFEHPRNYHLIEELHTLPSVGYLTKIRNPHKG